MIEVAMANRCVMFLSMFVLFLLPAAALADELRKDVPLPEGMEKYLDKDELEEDGKKERNRGAPNMCVYDCGKTMLACTQQCNVEKVDRNDPKLKKVAGRKMTDSDKCVAKCGETQNRCLSACKK